MPNEVEEPVVPIYSPVQRARGAAQGFMDFIHSYGVAALAVGVVIGSAVNDLVKSLVDGLVSPFIALLWPGGRLQNLQVDLHGSIFKIGQVLNSFISFVVICTVVYLVIGLILKKENLLKK